MKRLMRIFGIVFFATLSLFLIAFGVTYASVEDFLWFHAAAAPSESLDDIRPLYLALMKLIGGAAAALGLLGAYVTAFPIRRGDLKAAFALAIAYATPLVMAAHVAESLAAQTGSPTSWHIMGMLLLLDALALLTIATGKRA